MNQSRSLRRGFRGRRLVTDLYDEVRRYAGEYALYANDAWSKLYDGCIPSDLEVQEIAGKALLELTDDKSADDGGLSENKFQETGSSTDPQPLNRAA